MSIDLNLEPLEATIGAGALIVNDYALNITQIEHGYRLAVTRGSETQTMDVLDGVGVVGIEKTGSTGDVDSYRVSFTDGSTFEYTVETNAATYAAAEAARVDAENSRVSAEAERVSAEAGRVNAEDARVTSEAAREASENARADAESTRTHAEDGRQSAEAARATAEQNRASAESERVAAEEARATEFAGFSGEITQLKDDKLDKTPGIWPEWTADEQAAARERMGIPGEYELIADVTLEEDISYITFSKEPDGTPFNLKKFIVMISEFPEGSWNSSYLRIDAWTKESANLVLKYLRESTMQDKYVFLAYEAISPNLYRVDAGVQPINANIFLKGNSDISSRNYGKSLINDTNIIKINVSRSNSTDTLPAGTNIKLYGVRA